MPAKSIRFIQGLLTTTVLVMAAASPAATVPISLTAGGVAKSENFDTLASSSTSSTVPAGWAFLETGTSANGTYTAGTGSGTAGDTYSFGVAGAHALTERAFGGLLSGAVNPTIGAFFTNNTGRPITELSIAYTGEMWRLGRTNSALSDRMDFQLNLSVSGITPSLSAAGAWTDYNQLDFTSPIINAATGLRDGNATANRTAISYKITGLNISNGTTFGIRWNDFDVAGADDGLAVDDFSLTPTAVPLPPAIWAGLALMGTIAFRQARLARGKRLAN